MTDLPDDDALQTFVQDLKRLIPTEERPTGPVATIEQALVRLGIATIPLVLGPGIGTAEMIGIDLAQSLTPATGAMITTHVDAIHDADLAREALRDTGTATIRITMCVAFDSTTVAVATTTFHITAART